MAEQVDKKKHGSGSIRRDHRASYRDGTIMGLTAAEAFMLISFILLLLLTWRFLADVETKKELDRVRNFGDQFTQEEQRLAIEFRDRLHEFKENIDAIDLVITRSATELQVETGLELESRFGRLDPDLMGGRLRLMDKERLRVLLESVQDLPEDELQELTDMVSTEDLAKRLQEFQAFEDIGLEPEEIRRLQATTASIEDSRKELASRLQAFEDIGLAPEEIRRLQAAAARIEDSRKELASRLQAFEDIGLKPEEIQRLQVTAARVEDSRKELASRLQAFEDIGLTQEEIRRLQVDAERVKNFRQGRERSRADVAKQLRQQIGARIAPLGGRILDNGDVIFPDRGLFEAGSAKISSEFDGVLQGVCRRWFEVLHNERRHLDTVQIEGHASSEFRDLGARQAFDANLDLSQQRASAVFKRCLDFGGRDEIANWAKSRLVAIGFSSARPVTRSGVEDRRASRRVEFAIGMKSEDEVVRDGTE